MNKFSLAMLLAASLAAASLVLSCGGGSTPVPSQDKPLVAVSILPQEYFVKQIAGDRVDTLVLVGPGQSPHSYEATPGQMAALAKAKLWVTVGIEFEEGLLPKIQALYPGLSVVDGTKGIQFRELEAHSHEEEDHEGEVTGADDHGDEDHEGEGGKDPHHWLGRSQAKTQAQTILDALMALDPAGEEIYKANFGAFTTKVDRLFDELVQKLEPLKGRNVLVYHPAFGYFLDELGLNQVAIETGGKEPTPKTLTDIIREARHEKATAVFVQQQFPTEAAKTVAEAVGAQVVPLDDLAGDWEGNLRLMGEALQKALK